MVNKVVLLTKCQTTKEGMNGAKILLDALSTVAEKNAAVLCRGLMYEPEIPKRLRK